MATLLSRTGRPREQATDPFWLCIVLAGIGGMLPTLSRLAASLIGKSPELPAASFYVGLAIFFIMGAVMCCALNERLLKGALFAGMAAPAIIMSGQYGLRDEGSKVGAGTSEKAQPPLKPLLSSIPPVGFTASLLDMLVPTALAQTAPQPREVSCYQPSATAPSQSQTRGERYTYHVNLNWSGSTGWDIGSSNPWNLKVKCKQGGFDFQLSRLDSFSFETSNPVSRIELDDRRGSPHSVDLQANTGGTVRINLILETKKDIFWALGGKGIPRLRGFSGEFVPN